MNALRAILATVAGLAIGLNGSSPAGADEFKSPRKASRTINRQPVKAAESGSAKVDPATPAGVKLETAIFAGGCFWCMEFAFEQLAGVTDVESGYSGGTRSSANYDMVHMGMTAHAEAIRVTYDPQKISYEQLLDAFFDSHDPTQLNRQGEEDVGRQYRSAIFFANDEQQKQAKAKIADLQTRRVYKRIATKLEPLKEFYPAEDDHQDYARRNPLQPYIQDHAVPRAANVRKTHPDLIRNDR